MIKKYFFLIGRLNCAAARLPPERIFFKCSIPTTEESTYIAEIKRHIFWSEKMCNKKFWKKEIGSGVRKAHSTRAAQLRCRAFAAFFDRVALLRFDL